MYTYYVRIRSDWQIWKIGSCTSLFTLFFAHICGHAKTPDSWAEGVGEGGRGVLAVVFWEYRNMNTVHQSGGPVLSTAPYITQGTCRVGNGDMQPEGFVVVAVEGGGGKG